MRTIRRIIHWQSENHKSPQPLTIAKRCFLIFHVVILLFPSVVSALALRNECLFISSLPIFISLARQSVVFLFDLVHWSQTAFCAIFVLNLIPINYFECRDRDSFQCLWYFFLLSVRFVELPVLLHHGIECVFVRVLSDDAIEHSAFGAGTSVCVCRTVSLLSSHVNCATSMEKSRMLQFSIKFFVKQKTIFPLQWIFGYFQFTLATAFRLISICCWRDSICAQNLNWNLCGCCCCCTRFKVFVPDYHISSHISPTSSHEYFSIHNSRLILSIP